MTAFTRTWNAAYEAQPADTENISLGASRIRNLKEDIQERLEVDHFHAGDTQDGEHKKLTFGAPIATPANVANKAFLYGKDVSSKIELFYLDEDGNEVQLTGAGSIANFPSGTKMLFVQTSAPTGWTKDTDQNDKALRVVSGTPSAGGATAFSSVFGSGKTAGATTLTTAQIPNTVPISSGGFANITVVQSGTFNVPQSTNVWTQATGGSHNHTLSLDLQFMDVIKATKD